MLQVGWLFCICDKWQKDQITYPRLGMFISHFNPFERSMWTTAAPTWSGCRPQWFYGPLGQCLPMISNLCLIISRDKYPFIFHNISLVPIMFHSTPKLVGNKKKWNPKIMDQVLPRRLAHRWVRWGSSSGKTPTSGPGRQHMVLFWPWFVKPWMDSISWYIYI